MSCVRIGGHLNGGSPTTGACRYRCRTGTCQVFISTSDLTCDVDAVRIITPCSPNIFVNAILCLAIFTCNNVTVFGRCSDILHITVVDGYGIFSTSVQFYKFVIACIVSISDIDSRCRSNIRKGSNGGICIIILCISKC